MEQSKSDEEFVKSVTPYAKKAGQDLGIPYQWIVAHWAHETGYGKNTDTLNNNLAGVGHYDGQKTGFKFNSMDDFTKYYESLLKKPRYSSSLKATNVTQFAQSLQNGGYSSDSNYAHYSTWKQASSEALAYGGGGSIASIDVNQQKADTGYTGNDEKTTFFKGIFDSIKVGFADIIIVIFVIFLLYIVFIRKG